MKPKALRGIMHVEEELGVAPFSWLPNVTEDLIC